LQHRHAWREGFKAGVRTRESVGDEAVDRLIKDLELGSVYPIIKATGMSALLIRSANALKRLSKEQKQ
jgi:hypothetical protein